MRCGLIILRHRHSYKIVMSRIYGHACHINYFIEVGFKANYQTHGAKHETFVITYWCAKSCVLALRKNFVATFSML
jgi:hypothetical protein